MHCIQVNNIVGQDIAAAPAGYIPDVLCRLVFQLRMLPISASERHMSLQALYSAKIYPATQTMLQTADSSNTLSFSTFAPTIPRSCVIDLTWDFSPAPGKGTTLSKLESPIINISRLLNLSIDSIVESSARETNTASILNECDSEMKQKAPKTGGLGDAPEPLDSSAALFLI